MICICTMYNEGACNAMYNEEEVLDLSELEFQYGWEIPSGSWELSPDPL